MTKQKLVWGMLAALLAVVVSCTDWQVWDQLFERHPPAGARAWTGGDGAFSIPLDKPERTLWVFGDSLLTGYDATTDQRVYFGGSPDAPEALANVMFGSNMALQTDANTTSPNPANTHLFARAPGQTVSLDQFNDTTSPLPAGTEPFFSHSFMHVGGTGLLWPQGGYYSGGKLLLSQTEVVFCDANIGDPDCFAWCNPSATDCSKGLKVSQRVVTRIGDVTLAPDKWKFELNWTMNKQVGWGNSFVPDDEDGNGTVDWIYIYGARQTPTRTDAVIARATPANIMNPSNWQFRIAGSLPSGCTTTATLGSWAGVPSNACALHEVAHDVGVLFSVHKVVRRGLTAWLLVDTQPGSNFLTVRTSSKPLGFGDVDENTPRVDLGSIDSSIQAEIFWKNAGGLCNPELVQDTKVLNLFEDCSVTYHGRAHEELSFHDDGISNLLFSYIVPHGPQNQIQSAEYYRPRFGLIPIDNLPPFCTAAGVDCWSGVAYQGYNRTLGSTPFEWGFDVRRARGTQFYASFTSGTGNPELSVGFGSPVNTASCCTNDSGSVAECRCTVPANAKTAWVRVRGSGSFNLRTHYKDTELGWTPWFNRDSPNASGDYEQLQTFRDSGEVCQNPTEVQCRRISDHKDASQTGQITTCNTTSGFYCRHADQSGGAKCNDYEVRYYCGPTPWLSLDTPNGSGDYERISDYVSAGKGCAHPTHLQCRRRSDGLDYRAVGENVTCDPTYGFVCLNAEQPDGHCDDYEVRLSCGTL